MPIPLLDWSRAADRDRLESMLEATAATGTVSDGLRAQVSDFITTLRASGDAAVADYLRAYTHPAYDVEDIRVAPAAIAAAGAALPPDLVAALERAIDNVRAYQQHIVPSDPPLLRRHGGELGLRHTPVPSAGLSVPAGGGSYPSTLIMLAVPAQVAGVGRVVVATPPRGGGDRPQVDSTVLGVCHLLGIETVYALGGFALAALAFGTERVAAVDMIAGPSNVYGQETKRQLFGTVGIDGLYGPSEIVVLADASARPDWLAADLLAQAEHDPGSALLISEDAAVLRQIQQAVSHQLSGRARRAAIERALATTCALVQVADAQSAYELIDRIAPEHLTLAMADPEAALQQVHHAGAVFLGDRTPVASGDYWAGPSHCLPTGRTARFGSGASVYTFLKRSSIEAYPAGLPRQALDDIERLATVEGFEAHAHSVTVRRPAD